MTPGMRTPTQAFGSTPPASRPRSPYPASSTQFTRRAGSMVARTAADLAAAVGGPCVNKTTYYLVCCPAHNDRSPSLSLRDGEKRVLLRCFSGCSRDSIIDALKQRGIFIGNRDERDDHDNIPSFRAEARAQRAEPEKSEVIKPPIGKGSLHREQIDHHEYGRPTAVWHYRDAAGDALFLVCRFDWSDERGPQKAVLPYSYVQRQDGRRHWRWAGPRAPRPLYGLHRLAASHPKALAIVTEGEKCADTATTLFSPRGVGLTSLSGAGSVAHADWTPLTGRRVLILPDWDGPGWRYALDVAAQATAAGATKVEFGLIPSGPPENPTRSCEIGRDLHDLYQEGWTAPLLRQAVTAETMLITPVLPPVEWKEAPAASLNDMRKILASSLPGAI